MDAGRKNGITLIEVLVILVIVFVLGAIFIPVTGGSERGSGRRTQCLSNVKQLAMAVLIYSNDHDDRLPQAYRWANASLPYAKNNDVYSCPGIQPDRPGQFGHAFRRSLGARDIASIRKPEAEPMIFDSVDLSWSANGLLDLLPPKGRFTGGRNTVAFVDGHAVCRSRAQLFRSRNATPGD